MYIFWSHTAFSIVNIAILRDFKNATFCISWADAANYVLVCDQGRLKPASAATEAM